MNMISTSIIDKGNSIAESTSMSPFEGIYHVIQTTSDPTINNHLSMASYPYNLPYCIENSTLSLDYLSHTLPIDESIMENMSLEEIPWRYHHHRSSFLPPCHVVEEHFSSTISSDVVKDSHSLILTCDVESEGNLCNITKIFLVDISVKPGVSEHIQIGEHSSPSDVQLYTALFK